MTLDEIGLKHGTDKASSGHNYLRTYEWYFETLRERQLRIIEYGIWFGASIKTWREYFPNAEVIGVDINPDCLKNLPDGTIGVVGDTNSFKFWSEFATTGFDIVIDDGDHHAEAQWDAFAIAFSRVNPGGLYIIEDLHFSGRDCSDLIMKLLFWLNDEWQSQCGNPDIGKSRIAFVHLYKSLAIVGRK